MTNPVIKGIIFDFDGTILDTETPEYEAWQSISADYGVALPLDVWAAGVGVGVDENPFDPYRYLAECAGVPLDPNVLRERRHALFRESLYRLPPRPGILARLAEAEARGFAVGLASSSGHSWVDTHLDRLGLLERFPIRLCADDVRHTKPDPELYTRCLGTLGLSAGEAFAVEDSPNGIRAAKAAGLYCLVYPNPLTRLLPGIDALGDRRTDDLSELSLDAIVEEIRGGVSPR